MTVFPTPVLMPLPNIIIIVRIVENSSVRLLPLLDGAR